MTEDHKTGIGLAGSGATGGIVVWILANMDAINGVAHVILFLVSAFITLLGLRKVMSNTIDVNKPVTLRFEPQDLNMTLAAIEHLPYKIAHPLLTKITEQVRLQFTPKLPEIPSGE